MENYDKKIEELEEELKNLKEKKKQDDVRPDDEKLAELIHDKMCSWNHSDGCSWYYESWEDVGYARKKYLAKAKRILKIIDYKTAKEIIEAL